MSPGTIAILWGLHLGLRTLCFVIPMLGSVTSVVAAPTILELSITLQPSSQHKLAGQNVTFDVEAAGESLSYQWYRGEAPLTDDEKISGATKSLLTVSNVLKADEAGYFVVVSDAGSSVTSQVAALTVSDPVIIGHPASQSRNPVEKVTFNVAATGTLPLSYQWWKDGERIPGATDPVLTLTNLLSADVGSYWAVVENAHGSVTSIVAQLIFNYVTLQNAFEPGADVSITSAAVQPDGKILLGGEFAIPDIRPRYNLARFHANGFLDGEFQSDGVYSVSSLVVQPDGKILVGGESIRLNADGTQDTGFNAAKEFSTAMAVQTDGRIVTFIQIPQHDTYPRLAVVRLNLDGSMDQALTGSDMWLFVKSLVVAANGGILMAGGDFICCGLPDYLGWVSPDPGVSGFGGVRAAVASMILQADGKILLDGDFRLVGLTTLNGFGRLLPSGAVDSSFTPQSQASALVVQTDGKILVRSDFVWPDGQPRTYSRLEANGTLDESLDLDDYKVHCLLPDGKILAGHWTTNSEGQAHYCLARLTNTEPATESLSYEGSTITWLRGGTSPEVWHASFDYSLNGRDWIELGTGRLVPGGWQLSKVPPGIAGRIRARGLVAMGALRSHWLVESFLTLGPKMFVGVVGKEPKRHEFQVMGWPGQAVILDASTNLLHWTPLQTNIISAKPLYFADPERLLYPQRFYRARTE